MTTPPVVLVWGQLLTQGCRSKCRRAVSLCTCHFSSTCRRVRTRRAVWHSDKKLHAIVLSTLLVSHKECLQPLSRLWKKAFLILCIATKHGSCQGSRARKQAPRGLGDCACSRRWTLPLSCPVPCWSTRRWRCWSQRVAHCISCRSGPRGGWPGSAVESGEPKPFDAIQTSTEDTPVLSRTLRWDASR